MEKDVKQVHSFTGRKLTIDCLPHIICVFFYLVIAEGSRVLSDVFPLLCIGLGILALYFFGWRLIPQLVNNAITGLAC